MSCYGVEFLTCLKLLCIYNLSVYNAADLEKSQHERVSELQRLRSMYVLRGTPAV